MIALALVVTVGLLVWSRPHNPAHNPAPNPVPGTFLGAQPPVRIIDGRGPFARPAVNDEPDVRVALQIAHLRRQMAVVVDTVQAMSERDTDTAGRLDGLDEQLEHLALRIGAVDRALAEQSWRTDVRGARRAPPLK